MKTDTIQVEKMCPTPELSGAAGKPRHGAET